MTIFFYFQLLLQSDRVTLHKTPNRSRHQEVSLVDQPSALTKWQVLHKDPKFRIESQGCYVPVSINPSQCM